MSDVLLLNYNSSQVHFDLPPLTTSLEMNVTYIGAVSPTTDNTCTVECPCYHLNGDINGTKIVRLLFL